MKNATEVERRTNVIPLSFKDRRKKTTESSVGSDLEEIPNEIAHPASKNYPIDDPLADILNEFDDLDLNLDLSALEEEDEDLEEESEFIFHHQNNWDYGVELSQSPTEMAETVLKQIDRLKEDSKRIKYYLNELNLNQS